jgi:hypothetical protein
MHFSFVYPTNEEEAGAIVARAELLIPCGVRRATHSLWRTGLRRERGEA